MTDNRVLRLRDRNLTPPQGFTVRVPQTQLVVGAGRMDELVLRVRDHLLAAKLPIPMPVDVWVEDLLCRRLPSEMVRVRDGAANVFSSVLVKGPKLGEPAAVRATLLLLHTVRSAATAEGRALAPVPAETAEERTAICRGCPEMTSEPACYSCTVKSVLDPWTGYFGADNPALGCCHCDGVFLKPLVRSSGAVCNLRTPGVSYPKNCWRMEATDGEDRSAPAS